MATIPVLVVISSQIKQVDATGLVGHILDRFRCMKGHSDTSVGITVFLAVRDPRGARRTNFFVVVLSLREALLSFSAGSNIELN